MLVYGVPTPILRPITERLGNGFVDKIMRCRPEGSWSLDEPAEKGANAYDASGFARHGVYGNLAVRMQPPLTREAGGSVFTSSNQAIVTVPGDPYNQFQQMTFELLILVPSLPAANRQIASCRSTGANGWIANINTTGTITFFKGGTGLTTTRTMRLGVPTHVAATISTDNRVRIYIDGVLDATGANTTAVVVHAGNLLIGGPLIGCYIDEAAIYRYALSSSMISEHARLAKFGSIAPPMSAEAAVGTASPLHHYAGAA